MEFALACEEMGFGDAANDLFEELDPDESGSISSSELLEAVRERGASRDAKRLLYALAAGVSSQRVDVDASSWELAADSTEGLRRELANLLKDHVPPARTSDLWRLMVQGVGGMLSHTQLHDALGRVGLVREQRFLVPQLAKEVSPKGPTYTPKGWRLEHALGRQARDLLPIWLPPPKPQHIRLSSRG